MNLTTASMDLEDDQVRTRNIELNEFTADEVSFHINQLNQLQIKF